jgi:hypothetical protein
LDEVIATDALCVEGKKATFAHKGRVDMLKFFTGDGRAVHGKGSVNAGNLLIGGNHNFGVAYELELRLQPIHLVSDKFLFHSMQVHGFD